MQDTDNLTRVMAYFCDKYPHKDDLSKARLTKMVYLADWRSAIVNGRQVTSLEWVFNHYGPYLDTVYDIAKTDAHFKVRDERTMFGSPKQVIELVNGEGLAELDASTRVVLDHVIEKTKDLTWRKFLALVYSTYPVASQPKYSTLNLPALAHTYNEYKDPLTS